MTEIDTSGKALVEHWKWAAQKGLMKLNTARTFQAACTQVLGVLDGWESLDVRALDVNDVCRRFVNKRNKDFKPDSLETYKRRFALAVRQFIQYANDPSTWKPSGQERSTRKEKRASRSIEPEPAISVAERPASGTSAGGGGLVEYPFPLREGRFAYLRLPSDLRISDVKRLTAYLNTLAVDSEVGV